ncbi:hypothetical protein CMI37_07445 [Candidatus Pacearchaeota archaeon]|jgi:hypothetical protein|nr:hypothetical protein [Candidatus Pacearchaeota archaeon]|tara:strand:+ start:1124 stop:1762 length:639 start_codon:yes stop_codon:yes gene_type:complete
MPYDDYGEFGFYPPGVGGVPVGQQPYPTPQLLGPEGYAAASLDPPHRAQMGGRGPNLPPFMRTNIWPPQLLLSTNSQVGHQTRVYTTGILNQAQNVQAQVVIQFDIPCIIFSMTAACSNTAAPGFGVPNGSGLETFTCSLEHTNGDRLTTQPALGSCIFGTATEPALVGGNGWVFDRGSGLVIQVTPLVNANQRIDFAFMAVEERGPRNLTR